MNLGLTDDQQFFQETTRKFLEQEAPLTTVRALADDARRVRPRAGGRRGAELGWTSLLVPEDDGGGSLSGEGVVDLAIVAEEMGRLVSPGPLVPTNVVADAVARGGIGRAARRGAARASSPARSWRAWCIAGPGGGWDAHGVAVGAIRDGASTDDGSCSTASARRSSTPAQADELLVTARTDGGLTQCLVPASAPGVHDRADRVGRPRAALRHRALRRRAGARRPVVGEVGGAGRRGRAPAAARRRAAVRGDGRRARPRARVHPRVPRRPLLVRTAAGVVPGDQAPLRRHEDVARGLPRRHRARGARGAGRRSRRGRARRARRRRTSATTPPRSCRTACSCTAASASPGSTTCTSTCGGSRSTATCSARPRSTASASPTRSSPSYGPTIERPRGRRCLTRRRPSRSSASGRARGWPTNMPVLAPDAPPPDRAEDDETWARDKRAAAHAVGRRASPGSASRRSTAASGLTHRAPARVHRGVAALRDAAAPQRAALQHPRRRRSSTSARHEQKREVPPAHPQGRGAVGAVPLRAERRLRPRRLPHARRPRRRRVGAQRLEDLEHRGDVGHDAMCLARTDWDVPKHRGLTMFIMEIHQPGVQVDRIKQVNGSIEFCQEFFDDVRLPPDSVVGDVNDGWTVALALLAHERNAVGGGSPYVSGRNYLAEGADGAFDASCVKLVTPARHRRRPGGAPARRRGARARRRAARPGAARQPRHGDRRARRPVGRDHQAVHRHVGRAQDHDPASSSPAPTRSPGRPAPRRIGRGAGEDFLERQATSLAGGSNEIQRNLIAERVLGMPREWAADRDIPYKDVRSNTMPTSPGG